MPVSQNIGVYGVPKALAHLGSGDIPPSMDEQRGHLGIRESERLQHHRPVHAVGGNEDVLAYVVDHGAPPHQKLLGRARRNGIVAGGEAEVVHQRIEPDVGNEPWIERKLDSPGEAVLRTGDAKITLKFLHGVAEFGDAEFGNHEGLSLTAARGDQVEQPLAVLGETEVIVLLLAILHLTPLRPELAIRTTLLVGKKLFLADAVMTSSSRLVDPTTGARDGIPVLPEAG